jgi:hypothetical protein
MLINNICIVFITQHKKFIKILPWKYGISLHIRCPNIKLRSTWPTSVNGIQNTPRSKSDTACNIKRTIYYTVIHLIAYW